MRLRWGKAMAVRERVLEHLELVEETIRAMARGVEAALQGRPWEELEELAVTTHRQESRADDVRRKTELELVQGALLAGTRESLLGIIEGVDRLANAAEAAMDFLTLQQVSIPEPLVPIVQEILAVTQAQMVDVKACVTGLLDGDPNAMRVAEEVDRKEGRVDELERRAITRLFGTDLSLAEKILVREFVERLVEISDRAEDLSDLVLMAVAVRRP
jgi:hypothetical protein